METFHSKRRLYDQNYSVRKQPSSDVRNERLYKYKRFLGDLVMVRENRIKCVWFKDVNGILVSIPPESCLIEVEEIKENDDAS